MYYNSKPVVHDFTLRILGHASQSHNGLSSSTIICLLCSQQSHSATTYVYRNTNSSESSENCQICDWSNHTAKTCFYRNKNRPHPSQMTTMQATFPGYIQPPYMLSMMHMVFPSMPPMLNMMFSTVSPNLNFFCTYDWLYCICSCHYECFYFICYCHVQFYILTSLVDRFRCIQSHDTWPQQFVSSISIS